MLWCTIGRSVRYYAFQCLHVSLSVAEPKPKFSNRNLNHSRKSLPPKQKPKIRHQNRKSKTIYTKKLTKKWSLWKMNNRSSSYSCCNFFFDFKNPSCKKLHSFEAIHIFLGHITKYVWVGVESIRGSLHKKIAICRNLQQSIIIKNFNFCHRNQFTTFYHRNRNDLKFFSYWKWKLRPKVSHRNRNWSWFKNILSSKPKPIFATEINKQKHVRHWCFSEENGRIVLLYAFRGKNGKSVSQYAFRVKNGKSVR